MAARERRKERKKVKVDQMTGMSDIRVLRFSGEVQFHLQGKSISIEEEKENNFLIDSSNIEYTIILIYNIYNIGMS